ncbi:MAG TPA: DUF58 domain-containing protein [Dehalococcoidales bacterium]
MLGGAWIFITVVLLLLAIILKQAPLFIVAALFFLTSGIARLWSKYALQRLQYERHLSDTKAFFGDTISFDFSVTNNKFLPLPWLLIREEIPKNVNLLKGKVTSSFKNERVVLSSFISLGWYHRLTRKYRVECRKRGVFAFGPTDISSGDPFGFFRTRITLSEPVRLTVYPRIVPLEDIGIPSRHPFGDLRIKRHLFEDPVQVMTTRDYVSTDPMKYIHWKATARMQRLQSRVFEHTTTMDMALFLDTRSVANTNFWSVISSDFLETGILTVASIADHSFKEDYKVGFFANEYYHQSNHLMKLPPSNNPDQFRQILEALAQVQGFPPMTIEKLLAREARQLGWETSMVIITAVPTAELSASLKHFQRVGRKVALVLIGSGAQAPNLSGISTYRVSEEVYRRQAESIRLAQNG